MLSRTAGTVTGFFVLLGGCTTLTFPQYDIETISQTVSYAGADFSPDGQHVLVTSNENGVFNAYRIPVGGGNREQLTYSTSNAIRSLAWIDNDRFLYTSDQGGNELNHVYIGSILRGIPAIDLTRGSDHKALFQRLSTDRRGVLLYTNERDPRFFDAYRYDLRVVESSAAGPSFPRTRVFTNDGGFGPGPASADLRFLALTKRSSNKNADIYLVDTLEGTPRPLLITPHEGDATFNPEAFSPDGKSLYYTTDQNSEFRQLFRYDIATKQHRAVMRRFWDIQSVEFTADDRYRVVAVNENAETRLEVFNQLTGVPVPLPRVEGRTITSFSTSTDGKRFALYAGGSHTPSDLYLGDTAEWTVEPATRALPPEIDPDHLVAGTTVQYPSFDGLEIPALLFRPKQAGPDAKVPAVVWVHGGPGGQSRLTYRPTVQYLVNHGYGVLMVNNRGSSGYGKSFFHRDDRRHGEDDLQDCVHGRRYLETLDWVQDDRIGILGGSYGGYMVVAALAFTPEAFDCGIDIFGVTNWIRTLESIPSWWTAQRESLYAELGDPRTDRDRLRKISPLFSASRICRPLLVVQGANDPRVLKAESDEIVAAVRKNGVPVEYLVFSDEGHGFRKRTNSMAADRKYLQFLDTHLRGKKE